MRRLFHNHSMPNFRNIFLEYNFQQFNFVEPAELMLLTRDKAVCSALDRLDLLRRSLPEQIQMCRDSNPKLLCYTPLTLDYPLFAGSVPKLLNKKIPFEIFGFITVV